MSDTPPEVDPNDPANLEGYIKHKIVMMNKALNLSTETSLTFYELQEALLEYESIMTSLVILQIKARISAQRAKAHYQLWWDEKYVKVKVREHKLEIAGAKWASSADLACMVRVENSTEYLEHTEIMEAEDHKVAFMNHLIDQWKGYLKVLDVLSANTRSEVSMNKPRM